MKNKYRNKVLQQYYNYFTFLLKVAKIKDLCYSIIKV